MARFTVIPAGKAGHSDTIEEAVQWAEAESVKTGDVLIFDRHNGLVLVVRTTTVAYDPDELGM